MILSNGYMPRHTVKIGAKKTAAAVLTAILLLGTVTPALAAGAEQEKEEVIYVNLASDGSVKDVYAVNIFGGGDITDYGDYSSLELLNTTDKIVQNGDRVSFSSSADRVYLKGKLKNTDIPWNISIRYFIDGVEYSADEVAGKSGKLEISFKVERNGDCTGNFFDTYALQAAFTLDTKKCSNIEAADATVANVGAKKQISYTMLPGKGIDTVICADVTEFEMDAVSVNGVPLSMSIEVDDSEITDRVTELLDAIARLDDGAEELKDGASRLQDAAKDGLQTGVNKLANGAQTLFDGAAELNEGTQALQDGAEGLKDGAYALNDGAVSLNDGIALIQAGLSELDGKSSALTDGSAEISNALTAIGQA